MPHETSLPLDVQYLQDAFWSAVFGCDGFEPGVRMAARPLAEGELRIVVGGRGEATIVRTPPALALSIGDLIAQRDQAEVLDPGFWRGLLGAHVQDVTGPYRSFYGTAEMLPAGLPDTARALTEADRPALERMRAAAEPNEWHEAGLDHVPAIELVHGVFADGELVAACGLEPRPEQFAMNVAVYCAASRRGRGLALAAAAGAIRAAEMTAQWMVRPENRGSLALAERLGLAPYGAWMEIRLG